eukprot:CAMPEP_0173455138 /NCGR_PEP_ID=MMETSP1357-20121228/53738_1 /TAXON_ID=77926 /ORGANISM="Hemiselmis rufescens, Strain PCC563" /LENGTH=68 /DNA_ID=CAMNT_0014422237 /DNA_START=171 /DNA_END=374 /DNA_ORIENTATION=+
MFQSSSRAATCTLSSGAEEAEPCRSGGLVAASASSESCSSLACEEEGSTSDGSTRTGGLLELLRGVCS